MKKVLAILCIATVSVVANGALEVQVFSTPVNSYNVTVVSGPIGMYNNGDSFSTFCLERQESVSQDNYFVVLNTGAVMGGEISGFDPLGVETAYIYSEYLDGSLAGLGFNYGSYDSHWALQNVIWELEGEGSVVGLGDPTTLAGKLYAYANATTWTDIDGIRVMNLYDEFRNCKQDMLVKTNVIPAPGAILLGSIGVSFVGWLRRRRRS